MNKILASTLLALFAAALLPVVAHSQVIITEVDAAGSTSTNGYAADWFEIKNIGLSDVNLTGWKIDDNSSNFVSGALSLRGVTNLAPGQFAVFIESNTSGTQDATIISNFLASWFGTGVPSGILVGTYGGSAVSFSQTTDGVNIFDGSGNIQAYVSFGVSTLGATFDNVAGLSGSISGLSQVGVNGAFLSATGYEIGSPGGLAPVPEPSTWALGAVSAMALGLFRRARKA